MASSKQRRRNRYRLTPNLIPRVSIPRNPVATLTSLVTPRIGYRRTRRNAGPKKTAGLIHYSIRRRDLQPGRPKRPGQKIIIEGTVNDSRRLRSPNASLRRDCKKRPNSRQAGQTSRRKAGSGATPPDTRPFIPWCK